jgi:uncharacterized membrane-anchored protein YhcB (DUF1043 family)
MPPESEDWRDYRRLILEALQRLETGLAKTQTDLEDVKRKMATIHQDVERHNNHEARLSALENLTTHYNTILAIIGAMAVSAWGFLITKLFR